MAPGASPLGCVPCCKSIATEQVLPRGDRTNVVGVDAVPGVALEVIEHHPFGDWAIHARPSKHMTAHILGAIPEAGIASPQKGGSPDVASSDALIPLGVEPLVRRKADA